MNSSVQVLSAQELTRNTPAAPTPSPQLSKENSNLDFLRAFAVLLVFFGHLTCFHGLLTFGPLNLLLMGALGVLFFFVHTCLVLMLSLERQWAGPFAAVAGKVHGAKNLFVEFMIRRCFRIYPLSVTAVVLIAALHLPQATVQPSHFSGFRFDGGDLISNLFLVQNLTHRVPILGPMWSLPYEMQMYLFLPWLFLLVRPNRSIWRVAGVWALTIGLGAMVLRYMPNPNFVLYAPCFLPGVLAYQAQRKMRPRVPAFLWPLFVVLLAAFFLVGGLGENWTKKWATCLLLGLAVPTFSQISAQWLVTAAHFIAKYSYGIYLTHFFCIWFAFERLGNLPALAKIPLFVALAVGLPVLFYHLLEEPLIRVGQRAAKSYARATRPSSPSPRRFQPLAPPPRTHNPVDN